ncbi:hypothetical protein HAX54_036005 [Datura stramonium]|uniref:Uncharacterized protein n=1 Tax=Datura stramonium TaxID=4076 RepID=A0ABS8SFU5_DATST|nr:hypothetical protein [Datura stramonium]
MVSWRASGVSALEVLHNANLHFAVALVPFESGSPPLLRSGPLWRSEPHYGETWYLTNTPTITARSCFIMKIPALQWCLVK